MARSNFPNLAVPGTPVDGAKGAAAVDAAPRVSGRRPLVVNLLISLRPSQWTKNLLVFAALVFAVKLFDPPSVVAAVEAFAIFCVLSGVVYLVNDVADRESDRRHPTKRHRPIASGALPIGTAASAAAEATAAVEPARTSASSSGRAISVTAGASRRRPIPARRRCWRCRERLA